MEPIGRPVTPLHRDYRSGETVVSKPKSILELRSSPEKEHVSQHHARQRMTCALRSMPVPDLIVGKLGCAQLPAELAPLLADLARPL